MMVVMITAATQAKIIPTIAPAFNPLSLVFEYLKFLIISFSSSFISSSFISSSFLPSSISSVLLLWILITKFSSPKFAKEPWKSPSIFSFGLHNKVISFSPDFNTSQEIFLFSPGFEFTVKFKV